MAESKSRDEADIQEAVRQVNELTDSGPVDGEELLESEDLKRQFREAKARILRFPGEGHN